MLDCNRFLPVLIALIFVTAGCRKQPFVPDESAAIYLEAVPPVIFIGGTARILISGEKANGYPLPDQTVVTLSTGYGEIDREVTLSGGRGEALFRADDHYVGDVNITARCGQAVIEPQPLTVTVTDREVVYLLINADPPHLPHEGGTSQIRVAALDSDMEGTADKNLWLECDSGRLSQSGHCLTDQDGWVEAVLTTEEAATVTARYKDIQTSVTVGIGEENQPPSADFVYSPQNPHSGETVYFNAGMSSDGDGKIVLYRWDFGDGGSGSGQTARHVYQVNAARTFVVVLKVTDDRGAEDVKTQEIGIDG
jgi:hypothetical protein